MSYLDRQLNQICSYWAPNGYDSGGDQAFIAPVTFNCRWQDKSELFIKTKGDESEIRAFVYAVTAMVVDGYLYLGTSVQSTPKNQSGADKIRKVEFSVDIRNKGRILYKAIL